MPRSTAFTLLELIIVLVIIATLLAAASPSLRGFYSSQRTSNAARQMLTLMQFAQQAAIDEGRIYRFNFDPIDRVYWLTMQDGAAFIEPVQHPIASDLYELPDDIEAFWIEPSGALAMRTFITFHPTGKVDPATIRLVGRLDEMLDITSGAITDRFRIVAVEQDRPASTPGSGSMQRGTGSLRSTVR